MCTAWRLCPDGFGGEWECLSCFCVTGVLHSLVDIESAAAVFFFFFFLGGGGGGGGGFGGVWGGVWGGGGGVFFFFFFLVGNAADEC